MPTDRHCTRFGAAAAVAASVTVHSASVAGQHAATPTPPPGPARLDPRRPPEVPLESFGSPERDGP